MIDLYAKGDRDRGRAGDLRLGRLWQKLATQAAGQKLPDRIQMDRFIFEYARRQQLAALDDFVGKQIQLAEFDPNQLNSGKVDASSTACPSAPTR